MTPQTSGAPDLSQTAQTNPLLNLWTDPLGLPPFAEVLPEHFAEAFAIGMREHLAEIEAIASQSETPTFANTVLALDQSAALLSRVNRLFSNLAAAHTNEEIQRIEREISPVLAAHDAKVALHEGVFSRLHQLHENRAALDLSPVDLRLLERLHLEFERSGAMLTGQARVRVAEIGERLASLQTAFSQRVLADESSWHLVLEGDDAFDGLPSWFPQAARAAGNALGLPHDTAVVTLSRSLITPFLTFSTRRDLREIAWKAWVERGANGGDNDTRELIVEILQLRLEYARLFGYETFADFQLADTMAKKPSAVAALLKQTWEPARAAALAEYEAVNALSRSQGQPDVAAWDWRFYAEQVRKERFDLDDAQIKPYFSLDNVLAAAFDCASELFGLHFTEQTASVTYHPDVRVFAVTNKAGHYVGTFLSDNYARPSKRSGAWMSSYRWRCDPSPEGHAWPVVANHNNFAKSDDTPTLLSLDDARTLFHEFGHGLHGLLSTAPYSSLAGTSVRRDFVELPSQLYEHWLLEPAVLRRHAKHYLTGEVIPDELIARIENAALFNQGFDTVEYCSSALVDLALHQTTDLADLDLEQFEREQLSEIAMPPAMVMRHRLPHFQHLFAGSGYASAYYVYLWAEVLDADAYDAFTEANNPFDPALAERLHRWVYASGDTIDPNEAYRQFRGRDATPEPMLRGRGLLV